MEKDIDKIRDFDKEALAKAQDIISEERKKKQTDKAVDVLRGIYDKRDVVEFNATAASKELRTIDNELKAIDKLTK